MKPPPLPVVVLAAGGSARMGRPKPLAPAPGGGTFLERVVNAARDARCGEILVVVGGDAEAVEKEARRLKATVVENGAWRRGRSTSIKAALPHLPRGTQAFLLHPVDHPLVRSLTVAALRRAWEEATPKPDALFPLHGGRRGHPLVLGATLFPALATLGDDESLRDALRRGGLDLRDCPVDDPGVHANLDRPGDIERNPPRDA